MNRIANTYPGNQWLVEDFWSQVDRDEAAEVRAVAAYDKPIRRDVIRAQVVGAILTYAIPAGNA